ncbi:MAG: TatD family hydrolase [Melioribacteraceae bacterium]
MYIDTHAHLFYKNFDGEIDQIIGRAKAAGVDFIIVPGTDLATSQSAVDLADKYECVYAAVGVHPHDSKEWDDSLLQKLEILAAHKKVVAIGEIGLDYYYDFSPREIQLKAFEDQIKLALKMKLPVIIHNRESNEDVMNLARKYKDSGLRAQYHCFAGSVADARELVEMRH